MTVRLSIRYVIQNLCTVLLIGSLFGCDSGEQWKDPGPRDVFDAFLMHYFRGEAQQAFEYVLPADREQLLAPLETAKLSPDQKPEPHQMLVVADVQNVYDISRMELAEPLDQAPAEGQRVTLILHKQDGTQSEAHLVWSQSRWYVDLPLEVSETEE